MTSFQRDVRDVINETVIMKILVFFYHLERGDHKSHTLSNRKIIFISYSVRESERERERERKKQRERERERERESLPLPLSSVAGLVWEPHNPEKLHAPDVFHTPAVSSVWGPSGQSRAPFF